ncbi:endonuclease/exonuclease/phosphatase [Aphanothece hegewaldii CCALA 016]|uniref:Endonuclease/exonuclease/phosphatase n=1 Tax=Aphanothece hegewaldii CCALA 016 TaxID=2107694 RepID=A0A2T1M0J3_9CHRO|nr:endonuclease/exonuclease/phosphatase [Aphanothece hegewaldii]PSF38125.1 endonuclease/exonuclease/phosphatase [Aphanothece hegewaldii CCALA 016]
MKLIKIFFCCLIIILIGCTNQDKITKLTVAGYNVESGDADPVFLATNYIAPINGVKIWGFSEVQGESWILPLKNGTEEGEGSNFTAILGTTGKADRLLVLYKDNELEEIKHFELNNINIGGKVRAPLVVQFRLKKTGQEFLFMANHLYRTNKVARQEQAQLLNKWASQQTLPIIAVGDYNFDWNVKSSVHDRGYDLITQNNIFKWIQPKSKFPTTCGNYNTILDFVFVSGKAQKWPATSTIYDRPNYCPDTPLSSDHRPIFASFQIQE